MYTENTTTMDMSFYDISNETHGLNARFGYLSFIGEPSSRPKPRKSEPYVHCYIQTILRVTVY